MKRIRITNVLFLGILHHTLHNIRNKFKTDLRVNAISLVFVFRSHFECIIAI